MGWEEDVKSLAEQESRKLDAKAQELQLELSIRDTGLQAREKTLRGEVEAFYLGAFGGTTNADVKTRGYSGAEPVSHGQGDDSKTGLFLGAILLYFGYKFFFKRKGR